MATHTPDVRLSLDLDDPSAIPYFLWDEPMTVAELRARLQGGTRPERLRLLGRILRSSASMATPARSRLSRLTPAQLAWVLSLITIGDGASLPGGVTPAELRDYLRGLIDRLVQLGHP